MTSRITLDVLLKPTAAAHAAVDTIAGLRPPADRKMRVLRWFAARGFDAYDAGFSVTLRGDAADLERLFGSRLIESPGPGPAFAFEQDPVVPDSIAEDVEAVTVSVQPDFFG